MQQRLGIGPAQDLIVLGHIGMGGQRHQIPGQMLAKWEEPRPEAVAASSSRSAM